MLIFEYESIGLREAGLLGIPEDVIHGIVNAFCALGRETDIHFRTRSVVSDPGDEFVLDLAVAGRAGVIVTHNVRDFKGSESFGIRVMTPGEFLRTIREESLWAPA